MKDFIKQRLNEALLNEYNDDYDDYDDYTEFIDFENKKPKKSINPKKSEKKDNFKLLIKTLKAFKTPNKDGIYTFKFGNSEIFFKQTGEVNVIELDLIQTPEEYKGKGSARTAMEQFLNVVDKLKIKVFLRVVPRDKTTSEKKLGDFYQSLGFHFDKGSDFEMIR